MLPPEEARVHLPRPEPAGSPFAGWPGVASVVQDAVTPLVTSFKVNDSSSVL